MARIVINRDEMTVDLVVWQAFGRQDDALVQATLELNPGLAALGPILPPGTELDLPEDVAVQPAERETVRLWS